MKDWMQGLLGIGLAVLLMISPVWAVQPDEILDDPRLEERARELSKDLRCLVCRNESIDESNADLARDLRLLVRERLMAGDGDEEVLDFIVDRYGEYVLLRPRTGGANSVLWLAGPAAFLLGLVMAGLFLRARSRAAASTEAALSEKEQARLKEILDE